MKTCPLRPIWKASFARFSHLVTEGGCSPVIDAVLRDQKERLTSMVAFIHLLMECEDDRRVLKLIRAVPYPSMDCVFMAEKCDAMIDKNLSGFNSVPAEVRPFEHFFQVLLGFIEEMFGPRP